MFADLRRVLRHARPRPPRDDPWVVLLTTYPVRCDGDGTPWCDQHTRRGKRNHATRDEALRAARRLRRRHEGFTPVPGNRHDDVFGHEPPWDSAAAHPVAPDVAYYIEVVHLDAYLRTPFRDVPACRY